MATDVGPCPVCGATHPDFFVFIEYRPEPNEEQQEAVRITDDLPLITAVLCTECDTVIQAMVNNQVYGDGRD